MIIILPRVTLGSTHLLTMRTLLFFFLGLLLLPLAGCDFGDDDGGTAQVALTSPDLEPDNILALNARATLTATVTDYDGDISALSYRWQVANGRAVFVSGSDDLGGQTTTTANTVETEGRTGGEERVTVQVHSPTGNIGEASLDFTINPPTGSAGCFDGPRFIFRYGFPGDSDVYTSAFDGSDRELAITTADDATLSPDGQWFAYAVFNYSGGFSSRVEVARCDGTARHTIPGGTGQDFIPQWSPDGGFVYFLRRNPDEDPLDPGGDRPGALELAVYNLESEEARLITDLNADAQGANHFVVSPDGTEIAFQHDTREFNGTYTYEYHIAVVPTGGGPVRILTDLGERDTNGIDWSPDGNTILFSWRGPPETMNRGIYALNPVGGSPLLVFADPSPESLPPQNPKYYANGTRIVWAGQEYDQDNIELWSIDANGGDVQQLSDSPSAELITDVWKPPTN